MAETRVGVDVGGTFTDVTLLTADGRLATAKVRTTDDQSEGVVAGVRAACAEAGVDPADVDGFSHATTVSVNALLEGTGAETALVTTAGFRDVLEIGRQDRPALYDLDAEKPDPLVPRGRRYEFDERASTEGIERPVDEDELDDLCERLADDGPESVAVCFLHAYAHPENERAVAERLREELDVPVSASHEVLAAFREYERTATTAVDASVTPEIDAYLSRLAERTAELGVPEPRVMQSNGGIAGTGTVREHAVTTVLSGPAAGVVGASAVADDSGVVTFDMGGTSTDVSLVRDGEIARTTEAEIAGHPVGVPMVDVTTVGAGGGSVAWVDAGGALRVGPRSAGANPGPACYGQGGDRPTVTDANLVLGYLGAATTLGGDLELDESAAADVLDDLAEAAELADRTEAAAGVHRVATASTTRAVRAVTVERGHDPRRFALVAFGGAGPMHAAALADALDVGRVVVPRAAGVLSAYGLLAADERHDAVRTVRTPLATADPDDVEAVYDDLAAAVLDETSDPDAATVERAADLRYAGQSFELTVPVGESFDAAAVGERFDAVHEREYGYRLDEARDLVTLRVTATVEREAPAPTADGAADARRGSREAVFGGERVETAVYDRERLGPDATLDGPAVVESDESTVVVPPAWTGTVRADGALVLAPEGTDD